MSSLTGVLLICSLSAPYTVPLNKCSVFLSVWDHPIPCLHLSGLLLSEVTKVEVTNSHQSGHKLDTDRLMDSMKVNCAKQGDAMEVPN